MSAQNSALRAEHAPMVVADHGVNDIAEPSDAGQLSYATKVSNVMGPHDVTELSDDDLEHVVGGLARVWITPDVVSPVPGEPRWGPHSGMIV